MNFKHWLLSEERILNEDFKTQREKFIQQGIQPPAVDYYLNNFKTIKDKKYKQINDPIKGLEHIKDRTNIDSYKIWKELEDFVDYVKSQVDVSGKTSYKNIKVDAEPIHTDNDLIIYYADTPQACVTYKGDVPYGWCIARSDASNMFYTYRFKEQEPSFYFVKNKERTNKELETFKGGNFIDKYHFFVIQVVRYADPENKDQKQYVVTSAQNDGDIEMSWNDILKLEPKLTNKHNIFISNPLGPKERELYDRFVNGISDKEFANLPYDEKDMYLNIYVRQDRPITDNQFKNLPLDLKNKYIGFGVGLSDEQVEMIDSKLYKRYEDVTKNKIEKTIGTDLPLQLTSNEADIFLKNINEFDLSQFSDNNFHGIYNSNNVELAKYILEKRRVNFKSIVSIPSSGNFEVLKYLLGDEVRNKQGDIVKLPEWIKPCTIESSAITHAAQNNNLDVEMVEYLIGKGAKINYSAVVTQLAQRNNLEMVKYLVEKLLEKGEEEISEDAVLNALKNNNLEMVEYLVGKGAKINNFTVLHAAHNNNLEMLKYWVEKIGSLGDVDLHYPINNGNLEIIKYLLGDEARDEKGNIVKLPEGIKPITVTSGDWKSIANSHARNIEEIKEYIIKKEQA